MSQINNELLLLSKQDIPFPQAQLSIHQPTIKEIGFIGEDIFFTGCQFLNFSKDLLPQEVKVSLEDRSDFEIFMSIMNEKDMTWKKYQNSVEIVLMLLFPNYQIHYDNFSIILANEKGISRIDENNYNIFKDIIVEMFGLDEFQGAADYNPVDSRASKIAEKLRNRKKKLEGEEKKKTAIYSRYLSILTIGECKDMNSFMEYSPFQLKDEFTRFQKKQAFDMYIQAKMAGAQNLDDVDNWMDDIHP